MKAVPSSPNAPTATLTTIRVWDVVVRLSHWTLALSFLIAYLTAESESLRLVHTTSGTVALAVVLFRTVWGFIGPPTARFSAFVRPLREVIGYLGSLLGPHPTHHTGHNPAGGWAVVALLALTGMAAATGLANYNEVGGKITEEAHELFANLSLALVIVHVLAVVLSSRLHQENLVKPMLTGRKLGHAAEEIPRYSGWLGAIFLIAWIAVWISATR